MYIFVYNVCTGVYELVLQYMYMCMYLFMCTLYIQQLWVIVF